MIRDGPRWELNAESQSRREKRREWEKVMDVASEAKQSPGLRILVGSGDRFSPSCLAMTLLCCWLKAKYDIMKTQLVFPLIKI